LPAPREHRAFSEHASPEGLRIVTAASPSVPFVCPVCKTGLEMTGDGYRCGTCARIYPTVEGVADFRVEADPYIGLDADRDKARHLAEAARTRTFEELVRYYYSVTPEDPPDLAARWTSRAVHEVAIAREFLQSVGIGPGASLAGPLLDLGCATGGLVVAASRVAPAVAGVDIALRWLVVARHRLREAGVDALLVCASARQLPFPAESFGTVVANDLLEHVDEPADVLREAARVSARGARVVVTANNRYAPLPEPQLRLWGVGYLPRRWQSPYVSWRRPDTHRYRIVLRSAAELVTLVRAAGWTDVRAEPAPLVAPHVGGAVVRAAVGIHNRLRTWPVIRSGLCWIGPRLLVSARKA